MAVARVLFICTGNIFRSQMAEGLLRTLGGAAIEVSSAGSEPRTAVPPEAIRCMKEIGVDISGQRPKSVELFLGRRFDYVITLCDHARQSCPTFPDAPETLHWSIPDPAEARGSEAERMQFYREVRNDLAARTLGLRLQLLTQAAQDVKPQALRE